jgi:hypothetical protein
MGSLLVTVLLEEILLSVIEKKLVTESEIG